MENGPVDIVDFPVENGGSFYSYVKLPEGMRIRPYLWMKNDVLHRCLMIFLMMQLRYLMMNFDDL